MNRRGARRQLNSKLNAELSGLNLLSSIDRCLSFLEKDIEGGEPILGNIWFDVVDRRYHKLINGRYSTFGDAESSPHKDKFKEFGERYSQICDDVNVGNSHGYHGFRDSPSINGPHPSNKGTEPRIGGAAIPHKVHI